MADLINPQLRHDADDNHHKMEVRVSRLIREVFKERGLTFAWPMGHTMPQVYWSSEERYHRYMFTQDNRLDCPIDLSAYASLRDHFRDDVRDRNEDVDKELAAESLATREMLIAAQQRNWWPAPHNDAPTLAARVPDTMMPPDRGTPSR